MKRIAVSVGLFLIAGALLVGCKEKEQEVQTPEKKQAAREEKVLTGKRVVMIIAPENFRDEELLESRRILTEKGAEVKVACVTLETARGMLGAEVKPDMLISDIKPDEWDAVILVGGTGASRYWDDSSIHAMLNEAVKQNKIVGAICIAPVTLANAGILSGKKATVYQSEIQRLKDKGAECTGKDVERDGNIITASGPEAARAFGFAIAQALKE